MNAVITHSLSQELQKRGLLPDECTLVEMHMPMDGVVVLRFDVILTAEKMALFAEALVAAAEVSK